MIMQRILLNTERSYIDGMSRQPGENGMLILDQDEVGARFIELKGGTNNVGNIFTRNGLPRAVTTLEWYRTDTHCHWLLKDTKEGIFPTVKPVFICDDYRNTLEIIHDPFQADILVSTNNGPWLPYTGLINVGAVDRPRGYWRAYIAKGDDRTESPIAYSLPYLAVNTGFDYTLDFNLE